MRNGQKAGVFILWMLITVVSVQSCAERNAQPEPRSAKNILYKTGENSDPARNRLDIYIPENAQKAPVLLWVHGGGWQIGNKDNVGAKASYFTRQGFLFVSIEYRLTPAVVHPAHVQDIAAATAWTYHHCAEYGGDPNRLFIMGHSAGAHLVALVSTDERYLKEQNLALNILKGCIPLDGAGYDIPAEIARGRNRAVEMFTAAFGKDPAVWKDASPINHIAAGKSIPPFLLIHAGLRPASREESHAMADLMTKAGIPATIKHAQDKNHMTLNRELGDPGDVPTQWITDFLKALL